MEVEEETQEVKLLGYMIVMLQDCLCIVILHSINISLKKFQTESCL